MSKKLGVLFFSLLMVGCLNRSGFESQELRFKIYRVYDSFERELVLLGDVNFEDVYEIYDDKYYYGFYKCLVPCLFAHVDNINLSRKRFLNVQTGECLDVEPILNKFEEPLENF